MTARGITYRLGCFMLGITLALAFAMCTGGCGTKQTEPEPLKCEPAEFCDTTTVKNGGIGERVNAPKEGEAPHAD